jgi:hypothetical protein
LCTLAITAPAHIIKVDRSDDPVEFANELQTLR